MNSHGIPDAFDHWLGPAENRYFGAGYRDSAAWCENAQLSWPQQSHTVVTAEGRLHAWERAGVPRVHHLSTTDAIVLAANAASLCLIGAGVAPSGRECHLEEVVVRAGTAPVYASTGIPIRAEFHQPDNAGSSGHVVHCWVGTIRVTLVLRAAGIGTARKLTEGPLDVASLLGPWSGRYFGDGYRVTRLRAERLEVTETMAACAFLAEPPTESIGIIECLALTSQLAQVLLYSSVGVRREHTGNLWMRHCRFTMRPAVGPLVADLNLIRLTRLSRGGSNLANASVRISEFPGWGGEAALAFEILPSSS